MRRLVLAAAAGLSLVYCVGEEPPAVAPSSPDAAADATPAPVEDAHFRTDAPAASCPFVSWPGRIVLCEAFDDPSYPSWDDRRLLGSASIEPTTVAFAAPSALHVTADAITESSGVEHVAWLKKTVPGWSAARIDLELRVEPYPGDGEEYRVDMAELRFGTQDDAGPPGPALKVQLLRHGDGEAHVGLATQANDTEGQSAERVPLPAGAYTHLTLTIAYAFGGLSGRLVGTNGTEANDNLEAGDLSGHEADDLTFVLGVRSFDNRIGGPPRGNIPWDFKIDNVSFVVED